MKAKGSALEGFSALYDGTGNSGVTLGLSIRCKITVEYELVRRMQLAGDRPHRGTPLGKMWELWPFDMLRRKVLEETQIFVTQIATQGYEAVEPITTMRLWGPYTEKVGEPRDWIPEEGNHVIPRHLRRTATRAWGYQGDELRIDRGVAFFIVGKFMRKASLGHVDEQAGVIIV